MNLVYDILRLFIGPWSAAPRGIDRVDLAYARHLFADWPGDVQGIMPTPWGVRLYDRTLVLKGLARLEEIWRENEAGEDPVLEMIKGRLRGETRVTLPPQSGGSAAARQWRLVRATGIPLGRPVRQVAPGAIYLNVGQLGWAAGMAMGWLGRRRDVTAVLMLHDAIPIEHPELVSRSGAWAFRQMIDVGARHIDGLITTTEAARAAVLRELAARGAGPRSLALPLPLAPGFLVDDPPDPDLRALDYCVMCGAIEPRKNHALLLRAWREMGSSAPKLVIVGSPAQGAEEVLAEIAALPGQVIHARGLSTQGLRRLIRGCRALLMPSLAEGFGLPIQEALALGAPVIASDLAAHREISGELARLLPADRIEPWIEAIRTPPLPAAYAPMQAGGYFHAVDAWLRECSQMQQNEGCGTNSSLARN